jgi:hypothetical protein
VAGPGDELATGVEEVLEVRRHLVEGRAELVQLARPGLRGAGAQVAAGESLRRGSQLIERPEDTATQE